MGLDYSFSQWKLIEIKNLYRYFFFSSYLSISIYKRMSDVKDILYSIFVIIWTQKWQNVTATISRIIQVDKYGDRIRWNPSRILAFMTVNGPYLTHFIWAVLRPYVTMPYTVENDHIRWENAVSDRLHSITIRKNTAVIRLIWTGANTMEDGRLWPCMIDLERF